MLDWVPQFPDDLKAQETLFKGKTHPRHRIRPSNQAVIIYKFGDALGAGFGSSFAINGKVYYHHEQWSNDHSQESSNHRELAYLVFAIEDAQRKGLQMGEGVIMHVIHVAGLRMMVQGTDELSRGVTTSGIMQGMDFCSFVPLHLSALERQGDSLKNWVRVDSKAQMQ